MNKAIKPNLKMRGVCLCQEKIVYYIKDGILSSTSYL